MVLRALGAGHVELAVGVVDRAVVGGGLVVVEFGRLIAFQTTSASIADLQITCKWDEEFRIIVAVRCLLSFLEAI